MAFLMNALGIGPAQQAKANQAAQNYAQGVNVNADDLAQAQAQSALVQELQRYQNFINQNPNPVNTWGQIQGPTAITGQIGGQSIPSSGNPQQAQMQMNPLILALMQQQAGQGMGQMRQTQAMPQQLQMQQNLSSLGYIPAQVRGSSQAPAQSPQVAMPQTQPQSIQAPLAGLTPKSPFFVSM